MTDNLDSISMIAYYGEMITKNVGLYNPTTCVYQFDIDKSNKNTVLKTQFSILNGVGICVNLQSCVAHMFYWWLFSHFAAVHIIFQKEKNYF